MRSRILTFLFASVAWHSFADDFQLSGWAITSQSTKVHLQNPLGEYLVLTQGDRETNGLALVSLNSKEGFCVVSWKAQFLTLYIGDHVATPYTAFASTDHQPVSDASITPYRSIPATQLVPMIREARHLPQEEQSKKMSSILNSYGAGNVHPSQPASAISESDNANHKPLESSALPMPGNTADSSKERTESALSVSEGNALLRSILNSPVPGVGELVGNADDIRALNDLKRNLPEGDLHVRVELQLRGYASPSINPDDYR